MHPSPVYPHFEPLTLLSLPDLLNISDLSLFFFSKLLVESIRGFALFVVAAHSGEEEEEEGLDKKEKKKTTTHRYITQWDLNLSSKNLANYT